MFTERTSVGLDVHARLVAAAAIDGVTGELVTATLTPSIEQARAATVGILCNGPNPCPLSAPNPVAAGQATRNHDQWKISYTNRLLPSCHVQGTGVDGNGKPFFGKLIVADQKVSTAALGRFFTDGRVTTSGGVTSLTSPTATFYAGDIGKTIGGLGIPPAPPSRPSPAMATP